MELEADQSGFESESELELSSQEADWQNLNQSFYDFFSLFQNAQ